MQRKECKNLYTALKLYNNSCIILNNIYALIPHSQFNNDYYIDSCIHKKSAQRLGRDVKTVSGLNCSSLSKLVSSSHVTLLQELCCGAI